MSANAFGLIANNPSLPSRTLPCHLGPLEMEVGSCSMSVKMCQRISVWQDGELQPTRDYCHL